MGIDVGEWFETVAGACVSLYRFKMVEELLEAGVDVNASPTPHHTNLWQLVTRSMDPCCRALLPAVASRTADLFSLFHGSLASLTCMEIGEWQYKNVDLIISEELSKRSKEGIIALDAQYGVDERGWTLLDHVCFYSHGIYVKTARILRDAGMSVNFPLSCAFYLREVDELTAMINSGSVNYNEEMFPNIPLLLLMIEFGKTDASLIKAMIDHGANVIFPQYSMYKDAYECATEGERVAPLPQKLLDKIKEMVEAAHE